MVSLLHGNNGTNWQPIGIDQATRAMNVIDYEHHEIHGGSTFTCHFSNTCTNTGEMTIIAFNTPNTTKWIHLVFEASSTAGAYMAIYENADLDADEGQALTIYNRNRNSATTSAVTSIETTPVANRATSFVEAEAAGATLSTSTELQRIYMGAAASGANVRGDARASAEWVLKQNTQYAFVIVSTSDDDNVHNIALNWYEHTNKEA